MLWTPKRLPGKNLSCHLVCISPDMATVVLGEGESISVRLRYKDTAPLPGCTDITTDWRVPDPLPEHWRLMTSGVVSGLSDDPTTLAGRHVLHQAISLAVHLGFSRIHLQAPSPEPRLRRALDTLVRPLRHRRVLVTGCAPFAEE